MANNEISCEIGLHFWPENPQPFCLRVLYIGKER